MDIPRGKLIAIGGAVNKGDNEELESSEQSSNDFFELGILARMLKELPEPGSRIEIITTASEIPEETGQRYVEAFARLDHSNTDVIHIQNRDDVDDPAYAARIFTAGAVLFTGGNQLRLSSIFGGTNFIDVMHKKYMQEEFIIAGTSAGAMAMSNIMIQGSSSVALLKNEVKISRGLGFIKEVTIDSHFVKRGRFSRLFQAVATNPVCVGIGLGEDTGLLITEGNKMEAIGSGLVIIVDGQNIRHSNIASARDNEPISIENLVVHILVNGNGYILSERKFLASYSEEFKVEIENLSNE
ncbi:MAG: cyanophycinase [Bacteroidetes bacterium]|nr:MAG: cyanophycinase [Bacteroidota bacterium]